MGSRLTGDGVEKVYAAAGKWVESALRTDDSLFTPGKSIWSSRWLGELHERFLNQPDEGNRNFFEKLGDQLEGSPAEVYQLMGEVLYVHYLILAKVGNKQQQIKRVLERSRAPVDIPPELIAGLQSGFIDPGPGKMHIPFQVGTLIESIEQWKEHEPHERDRLLDDPWAFKDFLFARRFRSRLLTNNQNTGDLERHVLLHIVFPDSFERILRNDKERIAKSKAFARFVVEQTTDVDRAIEQIRQGIEAETGKVFDFYEEDIVSKWKGSTQPPANPWDEFVKRAKAYVDKGVLETEVEYKVEIGRKLTEAREAVLAGSDGWGSLVKRGIAGNLINGIEQARFRDWIDESPNDALIALQALWTEDGDFVSEGVRDFCDLLPRSASSGSGVRTTVASVLLMGIDAERFPPFRITVFNKAYERTGYDKPERNADEAALYDHALGFLDRFIKEADERRLPLRHRLAAQSLVWALQDDDGGTDIEEEDDQTQSGSAQFDLQTLADKVFLPAEFLENIKTLIEDKKQVIFQGPPGTGKTYVAQKLAEHLAGSKERVTLVQFHPSYAYEDFVQGFRPTTRNGQPGFELRDGPLLQAAERAKGEPDAKHFLVIDEINRGNLAKVFGELYFLLEYRESQMNLQYSDEAFSLPDNLYFIGTMNTADRSIALVDLALRRRFYFVEFHPDEEPIKGLLLRWLEANGLDRMAWVADVVNRANDKLKDDLHAAIGPSYFMKPGLDWAAVERIWKHSVLPYIEERRFGGSERTEDFSLDKMRRGDAGGNPGPDDNTENDSGERSEAASQNDA